MNRALSPIIAAFALAIGGCQSVSRTDLETVSYVDLERFMGDWYVIASIPTFLEKNAHNAVESYRLTPEGKIATTYTFHHGGFDGEQKTYRPVGYVLDRDTNAVWGMQFVWPIKADYRVIHLNDDYSQTVIGRNKRDYVWIMARTPSIPAEDMDEIMAMLERQGYDTTRIDPVPHKW